MLIFKRHPILTSITVGLFIFVAFSLISEKPERSVSSEQLTAVRVIEVKKYPLTVKAIGYGTVEPTETWQAIASVSGHVIEKNENLESGEIIPKGDLLLRLDPRRFELNVADAEAEIANISTEISKLKVERESIQRSLELERQRLQLSNNELERIQTLFKAGSVPLSVLEQQRQVTLTNKQTVAGLESSLDLIPIRLQSLDEKKKQATVRLERAQRDLADTIFYAPYELRINKSDVELHQYITQGQRLFSADNVASSEVEARIPVDEFKKVYESKFGSTRDFQSLGDLNFSGIHAKLNLVGMKNITWTGKLVRVAHGLEPKTRTVRAIIQIENPYQQLQLPNRPAVQPNMYVEAELYSNIDTPSIVIPVHTIKNSYVLVLDEHSKVRRRLLEISHYQGDLAIIESGLDEGDKVVLDDLPYIASGSTVQFKRNRDLEHRISLIAQGEKL